MEGKYQTGLTGILKIILLGAGIGNHRIKKRLVFYSKYSSSPSCFRVIRIRSVKSVVSFIVFG
jgi:hypothetical protein